MGTILDEKYSVTQLLPGNYCYVKWGESGTIPRALYEAQGQNWKPLVVPKGFFPVFPTFPVFLGPDSTPLPFFDSLTIIRLRGPKMQAMPGLIPRTD